MDSGPEGSGRGRSRSSVGAPTEQFRFQDDRASGASTATNMSGGSGSATSHPSERAITFNTADRCVISLAVDDLSSALGIRRADLVSQRLMLQGRSAPSYRLGSSRLGSAFSTGGGGETGFSSGIATTTTGVTTESPRTSESLCATPPLTRRPVYYQRRQSTLRATQLGVETSVLSSATVQLLPPPLPPSSTLSFLPCDDASSSSRRSGTPPPGGVGTCRRGLAGPHGAGTALFRGKDTEGDSSVEEEASSDCGEETTLLSATVTAPEPHSGADCRPSYTPRSALRSGASAPHARLAADNRINESRHQQACEEGGEEVHPATRSASPRRVHFADDVIESIHVAVPDNEFMRLVVVYTRPWYAYVLLALFGVLLGLSYASVMTLEEDLLRLKDRAMSAPFVFLIVIGMGAFVFTVHLLSCWRPDSEEQQGFFEDAGQRGRLPQLWSYCTLTILGLVTALVVSWSIISTVAGVMVVSLACHLVVEYINRGDSGDTVTHWDSLGCLTACIGVASMVLGDVLQGMMALDESLDFTLFSLSGWGMSVVVSGVCWTCFVRQLRDMSQRVSQHFLLSSSLVVSTLTLGLGTYVINMVLVSDEENTVRSDGADTRPTSTDTWISVSLSSNGVLLPCYRFFPDVVVLLGGGICSLLCWYAYHAVSFYVDHAASSACMVLGTVLSALPLIVLRAMRIRGVAATTAAVPLWPLVATAAGVAVADAGAAMVVWSGFRYRREAEIRIVLD